MGGDFGTKKIAKFMNMSSPSVEERGAVFAGDTDVICLILMMRRRLIMIHRDVKDRKMAFFFLHTKGTDGTLKT